MQNFLVASAPSCAIIQTDEDEHVGGTFLLGGFFCGDGFVAGWLFLCTPAGFSEPFTFAFDGH